LQHIPKSMKMFVPKKLKSQLMQFLDKDRLNFFNNMDEFSYRNQNRLDRIDYYKSNVWNINSTAVDYALTIKTNGIDKILHERFLEIVMPHIQPGSKTLDFGSGTGEVALSLSNFGLDVTALDISESMLRQLKRKDKMKKVQVYCCDGRRTPFQQETFDYVTSRQCLYHFPDWQVFLKEIIRITKPHGKIFIHFTSKENLDLANSLITVNSENSIYINSTNAENFENPSSFNAVVDNREMKNFLENNNCKLIDDVPFNFFNINKLLLGAADTPPPIFENTKQELSESKDVKKFVKLIDTSISNLKDSSLSFWRIFIIQKN